jgi:hypothetical protein
MNKSITKKADKGEMDTYKTLLEAETEQLRLGAVIGRSEQSCKYPDSCAMGYYHQIGNYYCSKCKKTGLQD